MSNSIELAKRYVPMLDLCYKQASLTSILDGSAQLMREGYNADEMIIPMLDMDGLGDYSRNSGYVDGDVELDWQTVKCNFDRGRMFQVDELDNIETGGVTFGYLAGEFIRTKVVPELDAFRIYKYATKEGVTKDYNTAITTGAKAIEAIRKANDAMDNDEVPYEGRILLATPSIIGKIQDMDTTKSRELIASFAAIIKMPANRFNDSITQNDGTTDGQESGGFSVPDDANPLNFMIVHPSALIQFNKLVKPKIITPEMNLKADAWKYGYRLVSIADVYANKLAGVYVSVNAEEPDDDDDDDNDPEGSPENGGNGGEGVGA